MKQRKLALFVHLAAEVTKFVYPTTEELMTYRRVMRHLCMLDMVQKLQELIGEGDPRIDESVIDDVLKAYTPAGYDEFTDRMADDYWERVARELDETIRDIVKKEEDK